VPGIGNDYLPPATSGHPTDCGGTVRKPVKDSNMSRIDGFVEQGFDFWNLGAENT